MKTSSIRELLNSVDNTIKASLERLISTSNTSSKYINTNAIKVDVFGMEELVVIDKELVFLDGNGHHYSLYTDCTNDDLVSIIESEETRQDVRDGQLDLAREIVVETGINIVTCGNCGDVNLHRLGEEEITCGTCGFTSEPCDFPDLFC